MSRLAREYPEATYEDLWDLGLRAVVPATTGMLYRYECRQCGDAVMVSQKQHDTYQANREARAKDENFIGSREPKCGACWN